MSADNPYRPLVAGYAELLRQREPLYATGVAAAVLNRPAVDARRVLLFSPHPDDECIVTGLALRLQRELGMIIANVAVTQGSREERQTERWQELERACAYLGFSLLATAERGLLHIHPQSRTEAPLHWAAAVEVIARLIAEQQPAVVFMPHDGDWHGTHVGTHLLVTDALARQPRGFQCLVVETEFWGAMATPNLLVESSIDEVADLVAALSLHAGEVARNPYHLRLPAWMMDNVRRGAELIGGWGGAAPDICFATLYRLSRWTEGRLQPALHPGRILGSGDDLVPLFAT